MLLKARRNQLRKDEGYTHNLFFIIQVIVKPVMNICRGDALDGVMTVARLSGWYMRPAFNVFLNDYHTVEDAHELTLLIFFYLRQSL